jgi:hypothetical protein
VGRAIDAEVVPVANRLWMYYATRDPAMKVQRVTAASAPLASEYGRASWTQEGDGPVLRPELPWEKQCIEAPSIVLRGQRLVMFYAGGYNNEPQQIGVATSTDGLRWERLAREPLVPNGPAGSWNSSESGHPGAFVDDDASTYLFYQGNPDRGRSWLLSCLRIDWQAERPVVRPLEGR